VHAPFNSFFDEKVQYGHRVFDNVHFGPRLLIEWLSHDLLY